MSHFLRSRVCFITISLGLLWGLRLVLGSRGQFHPDDYDDDHFDDSITPERLPFCPPPGDPPPNSWVGQEVWSPQSCITLTSGLQARNSNVLIVSTLDGRITALDPTLESGNVLWSVATEPGEMLSSTISQLELTSNAKWVKLIPSLAGGLYKFDGETVEAVPLNAETLLRTSFKFADNTVITGGKESRTYGIEVNTGNKRYECSLDGCKKFLTDDSMDDILIVQRETQTIRAVEPRDGQEKWNFSVSQHHLDFQPGLEDLCQQYDDLDLEQDLAAEGQHFKAVVSEGIICSVDKAFPDMIHWKHQFKAPIVHAWHLRRGKLHKVDLFSSSSIPEKKPELEGDDQSFQKPLLYVGTYNKQVYIQESDRIQEAPAAQHQLVNSNLEFPKVSWRPYLITADSRTPIYNHGSGVESDEDSRLPLLSYDDRTAENTALAVFSGSDYPFDSGLYLFPDEPDLDYEPLLSYKGPEHEEGDEENDEDANEEGQTQTIQIVFVSLWFWWKEVLSIALATAFVTNWLITRPYLHILRTNFKRRLDALARRRAVSSISVMTKNQLISLLLCRKLWLWRCLCQDLRIMPLLMGLEVVKSQPRHQTPTALTP